MALPFFWPEDGLSALADEAGDERDRNPWDVVAIGGYDLPGICEIVGLKSERDRITMKGHHTDGAKKAWRGYRPAEFDIRVTVWTKVQFAKLQEIVAHIWVREKGKTPEIFPIAHPQTRDLGVRQVSIVSVGQYERGKVDGSMVRVLRAQEHLDPSLIEPEPKQGKTKGNKKNTPTYPPDPLSRRLATLPPLQGNVSDEVQVVDGKVVGERRNIYATAKQEDAQLIGDDRK